MTRGIRTTVYIDRDLYTVGRGENLNFSEVMNYALAGVLGFDYESDRDLIRQRTQEMVIGIRQKFREETSRIEEEVRAAERDKIESKVREELQGRQQEVVHEVILDVLKNPASHTNRLPEADMFNDHASWWEEKSEQVSARAGVRVSTNELQNFVRQSIGRYA